MGRLAEEASDERFLLFLSAYYAIQICEMSDVNKMLELGEKIYANIFSQSFPGGVNVQELKTHLFAPVNSLKRIFDSKIDDVEKLEKMRITLLSIAKQAIALELEHPRK